jgi:predicted protein tyrosine phosphatase
MSRIHICPLADLETTLLKSRAQWMMSLSGPGQLPPQPEQITGGYLALTFNDIDNPRPGLLAPTGDHMSQMLQFLERWNGCDDLIIHCWMGISRSTAAAAIALARQTPDMDMMQMARDLRRASPMATPNPLMVSLADDQLALDGRLRDAIGSIGRGSHAAQGVPFALDIKR